MSLAPETFESLSLPAGFSLARDKQGRLCLIDSRKGAAGPLYVDFLAGASGWRLRDLSRNDLLPRAVGFKSARPPRTLLDATAGLGHDAASLALLGLDVTALEVSPVVFALLQDGLARARASGQELGRRIAERLTPLCADARSFLRLSAAECGSIPDVVYLDPMFPDKRKAARSRKEMQHLQALLPPPNAAELSELMKLALAVAAQRVVVKRPLHAPEIVDNPPPSHSHWGKSVRFDVYLVTSAHPR